MAVVGYANSGKTAEYNVASQRGLDFVAGATPGAQITGGDNSVWTKMPDGTTQITRGDDTWTIGNQLGNLQANLDQLTRNASDTSAKSAEQARIQRDWSANQAQIANDFAASEAAKNRDWQQYMSNTAHQREVADLRAAGLNPILSAMGGNGAAVTSGATAQSSMPSGTKGDVDTSVNAALASVLSSILGAQTQLQMADVSARTQQAVADKYTAMSQYVAELQDVTSRRNADVAADASKYHSDRTYAASVDSATIHSAATKYAADRSATVANIGNYQDYLARIYAADKSYAASTYATDKGLTGDILGDIAPWINAGINLGSAIGRLFKGGK